MAHSLKEVKTNLTAREKFSLALGTLAGLKEVETLIATKFDSEAPLLQQIPHYLFKLGGKRIRPILSLLVAKALKMETPTQPLLDVAAGIELIHMATLLHDDIIDKSPLRRHEQSPYVKFGLGDTLLSGDFLLVRAFSLCARLDSFIIDATEKACIELTEGEILEVPLSKQTHTVETSLTISRKKTASLFRLAAETAAHIATEGHAPVVTPFAEYGENLGIAFQILDDVLDVISTEDLLGKKAGTDIREQKPSAVNVAWLNSGSPLARKLLTGSQEPSDAEISTALDELRGGKVINDCRELARSYALAAADRIVAAEKAFGPLEHKAKEALSGLVTYILDRME